MTKLYFISNIGRMIIYLISGKRYSGKDYIAKKIESEFKNVFVTSFAKALKKEVSLKYGLDFERLMHDRKYKEQSRLLLINHATFMKETYGQEYWVRLLLRDINYGINDIIITDWRFKAEYEYLNKTYPIVTIRINSTNEQRKNRGWLENPTDEGVSETELDEFPFDRIINN